MAMAQPPIATPWATPVAEPGVVMGVVVESVPQGIPADAKPSASSSSSSKAASSSEQLPPLMEMCEEFKRQLGVGKGGSDTLVQIVDAACRELGVDTTGLTVKDKATTVWHMLHG